MLKCEHKKPYRDAAHAGKVAKKCKGRGQPGADRLRVYHCPECGLYHLTSQKKRGTKP